MYGYSRSALGIDWLKAAAVAAACYFAVSANAATYYISPSGDDKNQGTSPASPWATFTKARSASPGDTIYVMGGTYHGASNFFSIVSSGKPAAWITFVGDPTNRPQIIGGPHDYQGIYIAASYIKVIGFDVTSTNSPCSEGIGHAPGIHHIAIVSNYVHDNSGGGIQIGGSDYVTIAYNKVSGNGFRCIDQDSGITLGFGVAFDNAPGFHNYIVGNISYNNFNKVPQGQHSTDGEGIIIDDMNNDQRSTMTYLNATLVERNIAFNNGGACIEVFNSSNVTVRKYTCYGNSQDANISGFHYEVGTFSYGTGWGINNAFYDNAIYATGTLGYLGSITRGSATVSSLNTTDGLRVGAPISGRGVLSGTTIVALGDHSLTLSQDATVNGSDVILTTMPMNMPSYGLVELGGLNNFFDYNISYSVASAEHGSLRVKPQGSSFWGSHNLFDVNPAFAAPDVTLNNWTGILSAFSLSGGSPGANAGAIFPTNTPLSVNVNGLQEATPTGSTNMGYE